MGSFKSWKVADINERKVSYHLYGPTTAKSELPAIVCVCGWAMVKEEWGKLPIELSEKRTVLAFDNPGIGDSGGGEDEFTIDSWTTAIVALVDKVLSPDAKFVVLGFSMGAFAAQHLAITRPDRIAGIICIGAQGSRKTATGGKGAGGFFKLGNKTWANGTPEDRNELLRYFWDEELIEAESKEDWNHHVAKNLRYKRTNGIIKKQMKLLSSVDPAEKLAQVLCPALILHSETDKIIGAKSAETLLADLGSPRKELVMLPGGHWLWGWVPWSKQASKTPPAATAAVANVILRFLDGPTAPSKL
eukprot:gnl/TRDRNA2_/TRDRNA2_181542_c0_seq1.p1 gnl/TRDRNA2_/TRDRNA2_181542_c0~~gnl/TRDRNA2_/TRDRNA2_181542_c0_seq1.p1  ORF type:complete len:303 (+),score=64.71 gnl/TRDRNA2_/TRDRNA2_181542_c0_seq1:64-972(+)